jgi:hypothetical protein
VVVADLGDDDGGVAATIDFQPSFTMVSGLLATLSRDGWMGGFARWLSRTVGSRVCVCCVCEWNSVAQAVVDSPWFETRRWIGSVERAVEAASSNEVTLAMAVGAVDWLAGRRIMIDGSVGVWKSWVNEMRW